MAFNFKNITGKHKFNGTFELNGIKYEYLLYLPILNSIERNEVIHFFGNRKHNGEICLDLTEEIMEDYIDNNEISAYIIINEVGSDETASGTLQIYDHCSGNKKQLLSNAFVWINDICRILGPSGVKTNVSPVGALLTFMEQLTIQNIKKKEIYLFVDTHDENNKTVLTEIYKKKYGFINNSIKDNNICFTNVNSEYIVMQKPELISNISIIDFSFLMKRIGGYRKKTNKQNKTKTKTKRWREI